MISKRMARGCAVAALAVVVALPGCGGSDGSSDAGTGTGGAGGGGMGGGGTGGRSGGTGGRASGSGGASTPDAGQDAFSLPDAFSFDGFSFDGFTFGMDGAVGGPCPAGVAAGTACTPGTDVACQPSSGGFCFCQGGSWTCF
jgi:hypothetical protein